MEKLYTVEEVAELASVTGRTIRNYLKSGRLVGRKIGGQWRFPENEVQRLLNGGGENEADFLQQPANSAVPNSDYNTLVDPGDYRAPISAPAASAGQPAAQAQENGAPQPYAAPAALPAAEAPAPQPLPAQDGQPFDLRLTLPFEEWLDAGGPTHTAPPIGEPPVADSPAAVAAPLSWPGRETAPAAPAPSTQASAAVHASAQAAQQAPFYAPAPFNAPPPQVEPGAPQTQPAAPTYQQQPAPAAVGVQAQPPQGYFPVPQAAYAPFPYDAEQPYLPYYPYPYYYYPVPAPQAGAFPAAGASPLAGPETLVRKVENSAKPENVENSATAAVPPAPQKDFLSNARPPEDLPVAARNLPHLQEDLQPEFSDVGLRVTKFISEVHDCSRGPMVCAVVDMHQTIATARATSERLADIAIQESEGGQLCQAFVEFDERYYIARYTIFGTSAFLYRCLKLIG